MHLLSDLGGEFVARVGIIRGVAAAIDSEPMLVTAVWITKRPNGLFTQFEDLVSRGGPTGHT